MSAANTTPNTAIKAATDKRAEDLKVVRAVITLMDDLTQVMTEEAELLAKQKFADQRELLKRKQRLALDYRATMKNIASQPELLKNAPDDMRASVRAGAQRLSDLAEVNARSLRASMLAVQRLLQSVVQIVKTEALPSGSYGNFKTDHLKLGTYSPTCTPVTVVRNA